MFLILIINQYSFSQYFIFFNLKTLLAYVAISFIEFCYKSLKPLVYLIIIFLEE